MRAVGHQFFSIENVFRTLSPFLNIPIIKLPYPSQGLFFRLKNILYILRLKKSNVHISGHDHYLLWYPFKQAILTIHDIEALRRKKGIKRWIFKRLWFDIPIKNASAVTTISEFTKQELLSLNDYKTDIYVIQNPLTIDADYNPKITWSKKLRVLQIGTKNNKNLNRLAKALKGINTELTIIGELNHEQIEVLALNQIGYINKVNVSKEELLNAYDYTDLVAFVSTYEGFGLPILEAQAIGRVVITSNISSMPEVAGGGAYFVDPYSVESIRNGICHLNEDIQLREELIKKGKENIERFNPELIANKYINLYRGLEE